MNPSACLRFLGLPLVAGLAIAAVAQPVSSPAVGSLDAHEQLGWAAARSAGIADLSWTDAEFAAFVAGLRAAHEKRPVPMGEAGRRLLAEMQRRVAEVRAREKAEQDPKLTEFLRTIRASTGLQKTDSGLLCRVILPGGGPRPRPGDMVVANLRVMLPDGRTEVAALSGQDAQVKVGDMPPGVNEALQMLALGGRGVFVVPPHLSFGSGQWPEGLPPGTPILLQIELKDILPAGPGG
jgi:FKBP-type peptidyl-prolyl cis-trans isomerase